MTLLTLGCLAVGFIVLVLTFAGGDRLRSATGDDVPPESLSRDIPPNPFRTSPYVPGRGIIPRHVVVVICGAIGCVLMVDSSPWDTWGG